MTTPHTGGTEQTPNSAPNDPDNNQPHNNQNPQNPRAGREFFQWLRQLGLRRGTNRWVGGVCSGVAHRLGWDPLLIRIIWFALCFFGGAGIALYGIAWLLLPDERDGSILVEEVTFGRVTPGFVISIIMVLGGVTGSTVTVPFFGVGLIVTIAVIIAAVAVLSSQSNWPQPWNNGRNNGGNNGNGWHYDPQTRQYVQNQQPPFATPQTPNADPTYAQNAAESETTAPTASFASNASTAYASSYAAGPAQPAMNQPWSTQPATPPANPAPPKYYAVRRPANQAFIGIVYGLLFLTAAAAAAVAFMIPENTFTGWQLFLLWVLVADVIVGLSLIVLGVIGRRSAAIGWMVAPLLILSLFATPQANRTVAHTQVGTMTVMSEKDYSSHDLSTLEDGVGVTMGELTIDLSDWKTSSASAGSECPTGDLPLTAALSSVTITLPRGCTWTSSDMTTVGSTVTSYFADGDSDSSSGLNISGSAVFSSIDISQE